MEKIEEIKTEFEIKILELEAKLGDNTILSKVEKQHTEDKKVWDVKIQEERKTW